jgi:predicted transcriptional regulator
MAEADSLPSAVNPQLVARIAGSYVRHNKIATAQLPVLIAEIHRSLTSLGRAAPPADEALTPAVSVRRSVRPDYVVCLECGYQGKMLRRHLAAAHGLDANAYRARWKLPPDHPLTAPNYTARRSTIAKQLGLGRRPGTSGSEPPPTVAEGPDPAVAASLSAPKTRRARKPRTAEQSAGVSGIGLRR